MEQLNRNNCVVDWIDFYEMSLKCGWNISTTLHKIEQVLNDIKGREYSEQVILRLKLHTIRKEKMKFDNLIDVSTGEPIEIDEPNGFKFNSLDEVRQCAQEAGERFRKVFGIEGEITSAHIAEANRLIDTIERDEGEPLIFNDKPE